MRRQTYMGADDFSGILLMAFKGKKCPTINWKVAFLSGSSTHGNILRANRLERMKS